MFLFSLFCVFLNDCLHQIFNDGNNKEVIIHEQSFAKNKRKIFITNNRLHRKWRQKRIKKLQISGDFYRKTSTLMTPSRCTL